MNKDFVLNAISVNEKITKIDDKNLSEKRVEKFFYNTEKSEEFKLVFTKKDVGKEIKRNYLFGFILIIFVILFYEFLESYNPTGLASKFAIYILISIGITLLYLFLSPLILSKNLIFEIDNFGQERILKQNVFGNTSTIVNLENVNIIKRINCKTNSYFLVSEQDDKKISEKSIIFKIENGNEKLIVETEKMLTEFIEKEIKIFNRT